ncbi:MAG TPA: TM0106 family RecB-like putative nuclease [Candidatus Thermoplasmatota archaeon]|nr:TM0106 family RecB-like putative nuclease [Candidatus Thermoplasmatota archaeon]
MPREIVTASDVYQWARSPFALWCEHHAPPHERDPPSGFQELLLRQGREHEARVVEARWPACETLAAATEAEGFAAALAAMQAGAPALHGAPLLDAAEGLGGRVDLLVRHDDAPSRFGAWHYRVVEVKLARNLGPEHRLQGAFYNHLLGRLQGHTPRTFTLVNGDGDETTFEHDEAELADVLAQVRAIRAGERVPAIYGSGIWPWESYTDRCAVEADDVSLVDGVGPALRGSLVAAGFATVRALAEAREEALGAIRGVGATRQRRLPVVARALASRTHVPLARVELPDSPVEVFLDLEGTGEQVAAEGIEPMDYLIGALVRDARGERYLPFVAHRLDAEAEMMRAFVEWLAAAPECVLYHWHHYEATHLRKLAQRHGFEHEWRTLIQPRLRDLHKDATRCFAFPTYGTGLKQVAPYVGFRWRHKDVNAMESIALYLEYARDPVPEREKLQKVLDYNEDDCRATRVVKDWLVAQAAAAPT